MIQLLDVRAPSLQWRGPGLHKSGAWVHKPGCRVKLQARWLPNLPIWLRLAGHPVAGGFTDGRSCGLLPVVQVLQLVDGAGMLLDDLAHLVVVTTSVGNVLDLVGVPTGLLQGLLLVLAFSNLVGSPQSQRWYAVQMASA